MVKYRPHTQKSNKFWDDNCSISYCYDDTHNPLNELFQMHTQYQKRIYHQKSHSHNFPNALIHGIYL